MSAPILRLEHLSVGYTRRGGHGAAVIDDVSLSVRKGELVTLLGPNGAGKSTLLRTIAGMQQPLAGRVWLDDRDVHRMPSRELARTLSVVLTERLSTSLLTVYEVVSIGRHPHSDWRGALTTRDRQVVRRAIETVNAQAFIDRSLTELSDGERQRVMLARALAQEPRVLILDEITAFLDLPRRVEIMHLLRQLAHDGDHAILMSTHDLELALRHADTVWLCAMGGQVSVGPPEELVWTGTLERAFRNEGLRFDADRGSFTTPQSPRGTVCLLGAGLHSRWTGRALERIGFDVVDAPNGCPEIEVYVTADAVSWTVRAGAITRRVHSLNELLRTIRDEAVPVPPSIRS